MSIPDNHNYYQEKGLTLADINVTVDVRACTRGEELSAAGKCLECQGPYQYLLEAPSETTSCLECPTSKAICEGGSNIYPLEGYWRSDKYSDNFI